MNSFIVILSCVAAITLANPAQDIIVTFNSIGARQCRINCRTRNVNDCPPTNCPPPERDGQCGAPDCSISGNRLVLHPHPDPNFFYQCFPTHPVGPLEPIARPCGCGTLFSVTANQHQCVHPHEWVRDCPAQPANPILSGEFCSTECPNCDDGGGGGNGGTTGGGGGGNGDNTTPGTTIGLTLPPITVEPPPQTTTRGNGGGGDNGCQCPCLPCIWWPCQPCLSNCACQQQPQQPPQPRPQPIPQPERPWNPQPPMVPLPPNQRPQRPWEQPVVPPQQLPQQIPNQRPQRPWEQPQPPQNPWQQW